MEYWKTRQLLEWIFFGEAGTHIPFSSLFLKPQKIFTHRLLFLLEAKIRFEDGLVDHENELEIMKEMEKMVENQKIGIVERIGISEKTKKSKKDSKSISEFELMTNNK
ncbi:Protein CBG27138 [Caenorhabditis briggsae]|uniref:Protein CBG27138 n=1 Tax=Caenorhabditis briggsae TaxID=6238 RepID=B6IL48_CAEBR|nr:Protein CBG27138 [Caenorhabditis briggsae]CAS00601.1 Protein CBG27138 [Caenorhabditis briggsae]